MSARPRFDSKVSRVRRLKIAERIFWGLGLALIACFLAVRGYGEIMRRWELRRFANARAAASAPQAPPSNADAVPAPSPPDGESPSSAAASTAAPPSMAWPSGVDTARWSHKRIAGYEESLKEDLGAPLAILRIRRLGLEVPVLDGTDEPRLNRGVGRIEGTAALGQEGNVGIAGHRDGYFRCLKDIRVGDEVELETLTRTERYRVDDLRIVPPTDVSVLQSTPDAVITMVTCYPFYFVGSAPQRFIVRARAE